ncbi:hypothetical protein Cgig2_024035 [Carnegiea gigantea]|uniref:Cytochrome b5 heme-binding domain-containing protein n=1 Tax=Carnegiea gigantea TaxID=171969 RepID=A0A9Q1KKH4_9CARY|nr:hypothetical protein Cgig2_024035 [Carnegiea gigantea]
MEIAMAAIFILGLLAAFLFVMPRFTKPSQGSGAMSKDNRRNLHLQMCLVLMPSVIKFQFKMKASRRYTKAEVSLHNKRTDCWIIIKNKVYDVTSYVEEHPGGDAIMTHAGDDSTEVLHLICGDRQSLRNNAELLTYYFTSRDLGQFKLQAHYTPD